MDCIKNKSIFTTVCSIHLTDMLNVHNQARAEVGVPNLIYNSSLADQARQWADNCLFQHGGHDGAGQNLFQTSSTNQAASQSSATDCANAWVNEKQFFAGGTVPDGCCTNGFESCGHYTQVVWDTTTSVGCDYQDCSSNNQFARLWVCNYYPAGNIIGQKAFD
jgi:pathogenesis-related protein 1